MDFTYICQSRGAKTSYTYRRVAYTIPPKEDVEINQYRLYYDYYSVQVTDTTFAGKRGKRVPVFTVSSDYRDRDILYDVIEVIVSLAKKRVGFDQLVRTVKTVADGLDVDFYVSERRGVDVMPAGFEPIGIRGKGVSVYVGYNDFRVKDIDDPYNEMTCIPVAKGGKQSIPVFYRWVKENQSAIKNMSFRDVTKNMNQLGIKYHMYCAAD